MKMPKTNCLLISSIDKKLNLCFILVIFGKEIIVRGVGWVNYTGRLRPNGRVGILLAEVHQKGNLTFRSVQRSRRVKRCML